ARRILARSVEQQCGDLRWNRPGESWRHDERPHCLPWTRELATARSSAAGHGGLQTVARMSCASPEAGAALLHRHRLLDLGVVGLGSKQELNADVSDPVGLSIQASYALQAAASHEHQQNGVA